MKLEIQLILTAVLSLSSVSAQFGFNFPLAGNQQNFNDRRAYPQFNQLGAFFSGNPQQQSQQPFPAFFPGFNNQGNQNFFNQGNQNNRPNVNVRPQKPNERPQPAPATQSTTTTRRQFQTTTAAPDLSNERISKRKCYDYSQLIKRRIQVASLSLNASPQDIISTECDAVTGLIVGGIDASIGEFPHMAAIGYRNFDGDLSFKCGGSLISDYFVLTAAHCSTADRTAPTDVRLGDLNLKVKNKNEIDIAIDSFISHEQYNAGTRENDIALIKLAQQVIFNKFIRPACLQQTDVDAKKRIVATGWGYTEVGGSTSDILQKVGLDVISNQQCHDLYNDEDEYHIYPSQLCAGILKGGKDTCGGDSGGPLQKTIGNECIFSIIGVTSYGSTYCGNKNSPGVYTRVTSYLDWIEGKVWS